MEHAGEARIREVVERAHLLDHPFPQSPFDQAPHDDQEDGKHHDRWVEVEADGADGEPNGQHDEPEDELEKPADDLEDDHLRDLRYRLRIPAVKG